MRDPMGEPSLELEAETDTEAEAEAEAEADADAEPEGEERVELLQDWCRDTFGEQRLLSSKLRDGEYEGDRQPPS